MSLKRIAVILALVFAGVLAVVVAKEMSTEAMAVVIGVVCGVVAGIPTSVLLLMALTRRDRRRMDDLGRQSGYYGPRGENYPPVVVIQGGQPQGLASGSAANYWSGMQAPPMQRQFHVVGDEDLLGDDGSW